MGIDGINSIENIKPISKNTDISDSKNFSKISSDVKQKIELLELLDKEFLFSEEEQDDLIKKILEYNIGDKIKSAFDKEDVIDIITKFEKKNTKFEKKNTKSEIDNTKFEKKNTKFEKKNTKSEIDNTKSEKVESNNKGIESIKFFLKNLSGENESDYSNLLKLLENGSLDEIISELKNPKVLLSIASDLGAEEYRNFKQVLINIDPKLADIIGEIEKKSNGKTDINLEEVPPISSLSLEYSDYSFTKIINPQKLAEITNGSTDELNNIHNNGFLIINNFEKNSLNRQNFENIKNMENEFVIPYEIQIHSTEYEEYIYEQNTEKKQILLDQILEKINKQKEFLKDKKTDILSIYEDEIKDLVKREEEQKEEQLKTLRFINSIGFDLIPQEITIRLIAEIQNNIFDVNGFIPPLNAKTLDIENARFGEPDSEKGGTKWKENLIKFLNKLIYGEVEPKDSVLNVDAFLGPSGSNINPTEFIAILEEKGIKTGANFNINVMRENLER